MDSPSLFEQLGNLLQGHLLAVLVVASDQAAQLVIEVNLDAQGSLVLSQLDQAHVALSARESQVDPALLVELVHLRLHLTVSREYSSPYVVEVAFALLARLVHHHRDPLRPPLHRVQVVALVDLREHARERVLLPPIQVLVQVVDFLELLRHADRSEMRWGGVKHPNTRTYPG